MLQNLPQLLGHKIATFFGERVNYGVNPTSPSLDALNETLKTYSLSDFIPYESYDPGVGLFSNHSSIGFVLETPPLVGCSEQMQTMVSGIFRDLLPEESCLQCILYADSHINGFLENWQQARKGKGEITEYLAEQRINHLRNLIFEGSGSTCFRNYRFIMAYSKKGSLLNPLLKQETLSLKEQLSAALQNLGLPLKIWEASDLIHTLSGWFTSSQETSQDTRKWNQFDSLSKQILIPGQHFLIEPKHIVVNQDESYIRTYAVESEPDEWSLHAMGELIGDQFREYLRIPCPFMIHYGVYVPPQDSTSNRLKARAAYSERQATPSLIKLIPRLQEEAMEFSYMRERLAEGERLVRTNITITLFCPQNLIEKADQALHTVYKTKKWKLRANRIIHLQALLGCLPMSWGEGIHEDFTYHGRTKTTLSTESANLVPLQGEWCGTKSPGVLLSGRRGQLFTWSPFDNMSGNYNVCVVGRSGSGKSFFMQEMLTSTLGLGGRVFVLDVGRSFEKTCHLLGGQFIEFTTDTPLCINPFSTISTQSPEETSDALSMLRPIVAVMVAPKRGTTDIENAFIDKAVFAAWEKNGNQASIDDIAEWLQDQTDVRAKDLSTMLFPYTLQGAYGRFFNGTCNVNFKHNLVVIELGELKERKELQSVVFKTVFMQILNQMMGGDRKTPTLIKMDEIWDVLKGEQKEEAHYIEAGVRQSRKFFCALVFGTQSVHDFYASPAAQAAFENSDWLCLLSQKKESIAQLKKSERLLLDPAAEELLNSVTTQQGKFAEIMIVGPHGSAVGRLITDPFTRILYSTKAEEYAAVKHYQLQGMSLLNAVKQVSGVTG